MIKALFLDFDGTMTNGDIFVLPDGTQLKAYNAKDGMAVRAATNSGLLVFILSGNPVCGGLKERMLILGVSLFLTDVRDKASAMREIGRTYKFEVSEAAFMGDDVNDLEAMALVGISGAPADASRDVLARAGFVAKAPGGRGAVRDFVAFLSGPEAETNDEALERMDRGMRDAHLDAVQLSED